MYEKALQFLKSERTQILLPKATSVLLVVLIAYSLAQMTWAFIGEMPVSDNTPVKPLKLNTEPNRAAQHASSIANKNIFGKAPSKNRAAQSQIAAPETKLNLKLKGVFSTGDADGLAIIAQGNKEDIYKVGEKVPGNATLKEVYADRVILETNRGLETLHMPKNDKGLITFSEKASKTSAPQADADLEPEKVDSALSLKQYRRKLLKNPAALKEIVEVAPHYNESSGEFEGYTLNQLKDDPLIEGLGLKSGDVIMNINDIELDKPEKAAMALRKLARDKQVGITVLRNGEMTYITRKFE